MPPCSYGQSEGTVNGLNENTIDTENAIEAVKDYFHKGNRLIEKGQLFLNGMSMGGSDPPVPWETVKTFYKNMKAAKKDETLNLVSGGDHALENKPDQLRERLNEWYEKLLPK